MDPYKYDRRGNMSTSKMPQNFPGDISLNEKYNFNVNRFGGNNNYYKRYTYNSGTMHKVNSIEQPSSSYGNNSYSNVSNSVLVRRRENDNYFSQDIWKTI